MTQLDDIHHIAAKRWQYAIILSILMLVAYFGFILLVAFNRPFLSTIIMYVEKAGASVPALSWGILIGALVIVFAWVLTLLYVRWANTTYDREIASIRR